MAESNTFLDLLRLRRVEGEEDVFVSPSPPGATGPSPPTQAFGGSLLALSMQAAYHTLAPGSDMAVYSVLGSYLGPTSTAKPVFVSVQRLRTTRTFSTRFVTISQEISEGGKRRSTAVMTVDFIASSNKVDDDSISTPRYSVKPKGSWGDPLDHPTALEDINRRVEAGDLPKALVPVLFESFGLWNRVLETRWPSAESSLLMATVLGAKYIKDVSAWGATPSERLSAVWLRSHADLSDAAAAKYQEQFDHSLIPITGVSARACLIAWILDSCLAGLPLIGNGLDGRGFFVASLDFALRFIQDRPEANGWMLHEMRTVAGGETRAFSEAGLFDGKERGLMATMSQQTVLRPLPGKKRPSKL